MFWPTPNIYGVWLADALSWKLVTFSSQKNTMWQGGSQENHSDGARARGAPRGVPDARGDAEVYFLVFVKCDNS